MKNAFHLNIWRLWRWTLFAITLKLKILWCNNPISHDQDLEWGKIILFWLFWSLGSTQCQVQQGQSIKKHLSLRVQQHKKQSSYAYLLKLFNIFVKYLHAFFKIVTCICQYIKKHLSLFECNTKYVLELGVSYKARFREYDSVLSSNCGGIRALALYEMT